MWFYSRLILHSIQWETVRGSDYFLLKLKSLTQFSEQTKNLIEFYAAAGAGLNGKNVLIIES